MSYWVYIIESLQDHSFYIGYSENLENRLKQHNNGESIYTSRKIPWKLVYYEEFESKSSAIKRERFLKKQRNSNFYRSLRDNFKQTECSSSRSYKW
jgi:putative endonuclease